VQCKDAISFPMDIDLTNFVHPVVGGAKAEQPLQYTLTAIILHRGSSASSGHYVSIVKDERLGVWWKYDDDSVTNMGVHPFKGAKWDPVSGDQAEANGASGAKKAAGKKKSAGKATKAAPKTPAAAVAPKAKGSKSGMSTRGAKKSSDIIQIDDTSPPEQPADRSPEFTAVGDERATEPGVSTTVHHRKRSLAELSDSAQPALVDVLAGKAGAAAKRMCTTQPSPAADGSSLSDVQVCTPVPVAAEAGTSKSGCGDCDTIGTHRPVLSRHT
jgi:hypothetical protein